MNLVPSVDQVYQQVVQQEQTHGLQRVSELTIQGEKEVQQSDDRDLVKSQDLPVIEITSMKANYESLQERFMLLMQAKAKQSNKNLWPKVPTAPTEPFAVKFQRLLHSLSTLPVRYENATKLDGALSIIPLERIYGDAEDESRVLRAQAEIVG